jgi:hypothetical protein
MKISLAEDIQFGGFFKQPAVPGAVESSNCFTSFKNKLLKIVPFESKHGKILNHVASVIFIIVYICVCLFGTITSKNAVPYEHMNRTKHFQLQIYLHPDEIESTSFLLSRPLF